MTNIEIYSTFHEDDYPAMRCRVSWSDGDVDYECMADEPLFRLKWLELDLDDDYGTLVIRSAP